MHYRLPRRTWIPLLFGVICIILLVILGYQHFDLSLRIRFAREQVQVFSSMRDKAYAGDVQQAIGCLEYVVNYYPSGTKQVPSSPSDEIVEISRKVAIEDIIATLRHKSNKNYGANPQAWLENRKEISEK